MNCTLDVAVDLIARGPFARLAVSLLLLSALHGCSFLQFALIALDSFLLAASAPAPLSSPSPLAAAMDRHPRDSSFGSWLRDNGWGDSDQQQQQQRSSFGSYWAATEEEEEEQRRRAKEICEHGYDDAGAMDDDPPTASGAAAVSSSSSEPSTALGLAGSGWTEAVATIVQRNAKDKPTFKSLLVGKGSAAGGAKTDAPAASLPAASSAAPSPASPYMKPIRFVRAKEQTLAEKTAQGDSAEEAAVHKQANHVGLSKPNLLSRVAPASKAPSAAPSSRAAPSLLAPFKPPKTTSASPFKPLVPGVGASAAVVAVGGGSGGGSGFALAHIFHVSYRPAQRKKKPHREGYLHLFRSSVATAASDVSASASASAAAAVSTSLIKSHLYSERGHLIDEQLGSSSVMQYDESITKPQRKQRNPFGGGDGCGSGSKPKRKKRGDEVDSDSDEEGEEDSGFGFGSGGGGGGGSGFGSRLAEFNATEPEGSSSASAIAAPAVSSSTLPNVFSEGETVFLGSYECNLEEEITPQEYEKKKKIMSLFCMPSRDCSRGDGAA